MYWLGIDTGTGGTRALLIDEQGGVKAACTAPHDEMTMERPMWAEQRPENWWDAAVKAIQGVLREAGATGDQVKGIGLSGQMHGLVILDEDNAVIRPALIWCDQRSQAQVESINSTVGKTNVLAFTANPVLTGFTLPKLLWVRDNEPRKFARVRKMLLPKDYIRFKLTGEYATEVSDASGTALFDVVLRKWSDEMMERLKLDKSILPKVYESSDVTGVVTAEVAALTGLAEGTPVVGGGGDQASSAVGNGIVESGIVSCTLGTSGVVFAHMDRANYDPSGRVHTFCHAVKGKWHVMGVTQGAGLSLQWFRNQVAPGAEYDDLTAEAARSPQGAQGLFWLPYLMGERTPHLDPNARGALIGLTASHTREHIIRSILEGVAFSLRDSFTLFAEMGVPVKSIRLGGGGARSSLWRQIQADVYGHEVEIVEAEEGAAYGAAILAGVGAKMWSSVDEACSAAVRVARRVAPQPEVVKQMSASYAAYRRIYPAIRSIWE